MLKSKPFYLFFMSKAHFKIFFLSNQRFHSTKIILKSLKAYFSHRFLINARYSKEKKISTTLNIYAPISVFFRKKRNL